MIEKKFFRWTWRGLGQKSRKECPKCPAFSMTYALPRIDEKAAKRQKCRAVGALCMGRRGTNQFRLNDGRRAVRIARREGIEPSMIEIVTKDGTVFRIHGKASSTTTEAEQQWDDALTKIQKDKPASRSAPTRR